MKDQDRRAVEGMARCGIDLEGLCKAFPKFPREEVTEVFKAVHIAYAGMFEQDIKCCGADAR